MSRHRCTREGHDYLCIRTFIKENLIIMHYMLRAWWLNFLDGIGHYVIRPREIAHTLMMTNNIMNFGYTYEVNSMIISLGSRVSDFAIKSCAQKLKEQIKQANIKGVTLQYNLRV